MKILFIGDIFGSTGRKMIGEHLYTLKNKYQVDFVIANGENAAHGKGMTHKVYDELVFEGIQAITMGNHTYAKKELFEFIDEADRLIVPYNQIKILPGIGSRVFKINGQTIRVTNLLGTAFMNGYNSNPFIAMDELLIDCNEDYHIVDFHAETTSEKIALSYYLTGKVSAVLGTHTHVQTADEKIIDGKTAFISDVGMTGPKHGIIGCSKESILYKMTTGLNGKFEIEKGEGQLCGVVIDFDSKTHLPLSIERIMI
ncbi:MAG: TIGR00282 family metallophosphoesterase [Erysipelotrichaceae bacterium]|nr:TIGR00282 family metallophosphoesterase [Erysipelotrichaceae bacterium]